MLPLLPTLTEESVWIISYKSQNYRMEAFEGIHPLAYTKKAVARNEAYRLLNEWTRRIPILFYAPFIHGQIDADHVDDFYNHVFTPTSHNSFDISVDWEGHRLVMRYEELIVMV